jgi:CoA:oxalate CoA-transferase
MNDRHAYSGPYQGIKVLDLSEGVVGAFCSMQLGALGAQVLKIEPPGGDWLRTIPPCDGKISALFEAVNRNKVSTVLAFGDAGSDEALRRYISASDVVVTDISLDEGISALSYEQFAESIPHVVWGELSAYGKDGPLGGTPGTELTTQMTVGINRHLGRQDGGVVRLGFDMVSISASNFLFCGIAAALRERAVSGRGQKVEVSLLSSMVAMLSWNVAAESDPDEWIGSALTYDKPPSYGYELADGVVHLDFRWNEPQWPRFFAAVNRSDLVNDPRFATPELVHRNLSDLYQELQPSLREWRMHDLDPIVRNIGGAMVPIYEGVGAVEAAQANGLFDERAGSWMDQLSAPWLFSAIPIPVGADLRLASTENLSSYVGDRHEEAASS